MSSTYTTFEDFFVEQLEDIYDAEKRLVKALPKMAEAASNSELSRAIKSHLKETEGHVERLEKVFDMIGKSPESEPCEAMKGLIKEGEEAIKAKGDENIRDAALIAAAQRVEHYEISGYGTLRTVAQQLGYDEVAGLLQQTLDEESEADEKLTKIAEKSVNKKAAAAEK